MARVRRPASALCLRAKTSLRPFVGWMRSVLLATRGASAAKWCGRAPSSARLIPISGSARLAIEATVARRVELRKGLAAITRYLTAHQLSQERTLLRLDGQYGTGAVLTDLAGFAFVTRGKEYTVLDHPLVQARLHLPPDQVQRRPESQMVRSLYDCPAVPVGTEGVLCRVVVATHPAGKKKSPVGVTRDGVVYELFFTNLPQQGFAASDVVELYLHRGAFEPALADEDAELDPDRWCSHSAWGQECWQVISQWVWNLRLELGHQLQPEPVRTTEFAPALPSPSPHTAPPSGYASPQVGSTWKAGRFSGQAFALQPDGTLRCPADQTLLPHEQRREADGSLRVVYGASIRSCRSCRLREQCQWNGHATAKPRQVSVLLHPLPVGAAPLRLRAIGAGGTSGVPACSSCATSAWR
jgi:hypothetical protein